MDAVSSKLLGSPVDENSLVVFVRARKEQRAVTMLWTIFVVLLVLWLLGFSLHVGGGLIHLLLVVGLVVLVINLLSGRRTAV